MAPPMVITSMLLLMHARGVASQSHLALLQYRVNVSAASDGDFEYVGASHIVFGAGRRTGTIPERQEEEHPDNEQKAALLSIASQSANAAHRQQVTQIGCLAPITEDGYRQVAAAKNNGEMATFIRRVLANHGRSSSDQLGLKGLVPYYSGALATQSLEALLSELGTKGWVVFTPVGSAAPLTEEGFRTVAAARNTPEMITFIHRVLASRGYHVDGDAALAYTLQDHGIWALQPLESFIEKIVKEDWVAFKPGSAVPLTEDGYQTVVATKKDDQMDAFIRRVLAASGHISMDELALQGLVPHYSGTRAAQSLSALLVELGNKSWVVAAPLGSALREGDGKLFVSQCGQ